MRKTSIKKANNRSGFTLMEMLIVVAIIAVLVIIAIPVLAKQLEKSREAADMANIRSAYAEVTVEYLSEEDSDLSRTVELVQREDGWLDGSTAPDTLSSLGAVIGTPSAGGTCEVYWSDTGKDDKPGIVFDFGDGGGGTVTRKTYMTDVAAGLKKGLQQLIPPGKEAQADSCLHNHSYTADNGDVVTVKELQISPSNLQRGVYWNPNMVTWNELLEQAGVDTGRLTDVDGYVYLDSGHEPVCVSYYDEDGKYCYTYADNETLVFDKMPGERQHAAYYKDYAKSLVH